MIHLGHRPAPPRLAYVSWLAICLIWGTTYLAIRVTLESLPPTLGPGLRWTLAGVLVSLMQVARGRALPARRDWTSLAVIGFLFIVTGNGLVVWAELWVPSGLTAVLLATSPFWMLAVELCLPDGERPRRASWLGLFVGFSGIIVLVWPQLTGGGEMGWRFGVGVLALQAACLTWSIGAAYSRRHHLAGNPLSAAELEMIFGGLMLVVIGLALGEWRHFSFTVRTGAAFGYLVLVGSVMGYSAYLHALAHLPVSTVSLYAYINPVIAVILGRLLLDEPFGLRSLVASAMVLAGVVLVRDPRRETAVGEHDSP